MNSSVLTWSVMCKSTKCLRVTGISILLTYPKTNNRPFKHCPVCGEEAVVVPYSQDATWGHIAANLRLPINLVKQLHTAWNKQGSLRGYIREMLTS